MLAAMHGNYHKERIMGAKLIHGHASGQQYNILPGKHATCAQACPLFVSDLGCKSNSEHAHITP
jgi:hypothetical protein